MLFLFEYKRQEFLLFIFHISHMLENVFQSIFMNANKYQKTNCFSWNFQLKKFFIKKVLRWNKPKLGPKQYIS